MFIVNFIVVKPQFKTQFCYEMLNSTKCNNKRAITSRNNALYYYGVQWYSTHI